MRLPSSRIGWQRMFVILVIFGAIVIPFCVTIHEWPYLPQHRKLSPEKYAERISLLKYFLSLGFSVIGASWYLISGTSGYQRMTKNTFSLISWAWTCLGISLLSAIGQIYLTYKDFYYWPLITAEGYRDNFQKLKHIVGLRMLHGTYHITDYLFFIGSVLIVLALVEGLNSNGVNTNAQKKL